LAWHRGRRGARVRSSKVEYVDDDYEVRMKAWGFGKKVLSCSSVKVGLGWARLEKLGWSGIVFLFMYV